jgi:glycosyltransferase involved in cell wall biosynthesis
MHTDPPGNTRPEIVFWSDFPYGFHMRDGEEKMARFAARGYPVLYVEKIGIRNPRVRHLPWMARALLRPGRGGASHQRPFAVISPKLAFPRRAPLIPALNQRLLERQVVSRVANPSESVFWVRYPSPEIPPLVESVRPRLVVYEAIDLHEGGPGITERLRPLLLATEDALLAQARVVFAWSEPLRARFAAKHDNVVLAGPAIPVEQFSANAARAGEPNVATWTGSIDFRFDADLLAAAAQRLGEWRFLVAGPVLDRRAGQRLAATDNVELLGVLTADEVPELLARASVCVMPYRQNDFNDTIFPLKLAEYLAAGRPVVSTPIRSARELSDVVVTAGDADAFAAAVKLGAAKDSDEARRARVARAAPYAWDTRIDEMERAVQEALASP